MNRRELYAAGAPFGDCCTLPKAGGGYVCGGGGGSSKSASTTTTNTSVQDKRLVVDGGAVGISADNSTVSVQTLDAGIVGKALDVVQVSDAKNGEALNDMIVTLRDGFERLLSTTESQNDNLTISQRDGYENLLDATANANDVNAGLFGRMIDSANEMNTSSNNSFGKLIDIAASLFGKSADMIEKSQDATLAQIESINARAADQEGTIDQKTIIVMAVAGAAALVLGRGK